METELFVPQGLWHYKPEEFMQFLATHRFNAIRLPFSYEWAARGLDTPLLNPYVVQDDMRGFTQVCLLMHAYMCVCGKRNVWDIFIPHPRKAWPLVDPKDKQNAAHTHAHPDVHPQSL